MQNNPWRDMYFSLLYATEKVVPEKFIELHREFEKEYNLILEKNKKSENELDSDSG